MKRIFFLLIAITALLWACQPQVSGQSIRLNSNQLYASYTGVAGDTAKATTAKNFDIMVSKKFMYYYDIQVSADSSGDASNFSVQLSGSNDESNWYTIGSAATWCISSEDTILRFTNMTSVSTSTAIAATADYHALELAVSTDYINGDWTYADTSASGEVLQWAINDTITNSVRTAVDTVTVGARAITKTLTEASVGWRYLRVGFTGAAAGARCEMQLLTVAIRPKLFSY